MFLLIQNPYLSFIRKFRDPICAIKASYDLYIRYKIKYIYEVRVYRYYKFEIIILNNNIEFE